MLQHSILAPLLILLHNDEQSITQPCMTLVALRLNVIIAGRSEFDNSSRPVCTLKGSACAQVILQTIIQKHHITICQLDNYQTGLQSLLLQQEVTLY